MAAERLEYQSGSGLVAIWAADALQARSILPRQGNHPSTLVRRSWEGGARLAPDRSASRSAFDTNVGSVKWAAVLYLGFFTEHLDWSFAPSKA